MHSTLVYSFGLRSALQANCHVNADSEGRGDCHIERVLGAEMSVACELGMLEPSATHNCLDRLV